MFNGCTCVACRESWVEVVGEHVACPTCGSKELIRESWKVIRELQLLAAAAKDQIGAAIEAGNIRAARMIARETARRLGPWRAYVEFRYPIVQEEHAATDPVSCI